MDDYELVVSVAELMVKEKVLTEFGLKMLRNDIESDMATLNPQDKEKLTRTAIYFTILYNMAILFAGYCDEHEDPREKRLREIGAMVVEYIPKLLRGLEDTYLEVYHGAKVKAFENGQLFEDYLPQHPEEQKLLDKMNGTVKDENYTQTV
jgi:hypothetical protein